MDSRRISKALLKRLPIYLNYLKALPGEDQNISATTIAAALGLGHVQVRKDLAKVAHEGRRRTGRSREQLIADIEHYLDSATATRAVIVGAGRLGQALLDYPGFEKYGLQVEAGFDLQSMQTQTDGGRPIFPIDLLEAYCREQAIRIGIISVPAETAQEVCDRLVACGIQAIWNFAPVHLKVPESIALYNENLALSAAALRVRLRANTQEHTPHP